MAYWRITAAYKPVVSRRSKQATPVYGKPEVLSLCVDDAGDGIKTAIAKTRNWLGPDVVFDVRRFSQGEVF